MILAFLQKKVLPTTLTASGWILENSSNSRGSNRGAPVQGGEALLSAVRASRVHAHVHPRHRRGHRGQRGRNVPDREAGGRQHHPQVVRQEDRSPHPHVQ